MMEDSVVLISSETDSNDSNSTPVKTSYRCTGDDDLRLGLEEGDGLGLALDNSTDSTNALLDEWSPNKHDQNSEDRASSSIPDCNRVVHYISSSESSFEDLGGLSAQLNSDQDGGEMKGEDQSRRRFNPERFLHDLSDDDDVLGEDIGLGLKVSTEKDVGLGVTMCCCSNSDTEQGGHSKPSPHLNSDEGLSELSQGRGRFRPNHKRSHHDLSDDDDDIVGGGVKMSTIKFCSSSEEDRAVLSPQLISDDNLSDLSQDQCRLTPNPKHFLHNLLDEDDDIVGKDVKMSTKKGVTMEFCSSSDEDQDGFSPQLNSDDDLSDLSQDQGKLRPNPERCLHDLSDEDDIADEDVIMSTKKDVTMQVSSNSNVENLFLRCPQPNSDEDRNNRRSVSRSISDEDDTVIEIIGASHEDVTLQYDDWIDLSPVKSVESQPSSQLPYVESELHDDQLDVPQDQIENNLNQTRLSRMFCSARSVTSTHIAIKPSGSTGLMQERKKHKSSSPVKKLSAEEKRLAVKLRKEAREAERARKLAEKAELQAAKLALSKARQLLKPEESIKHLSVVLDNNIMELDLNGNLYHELEAIGVTYCIESQLIPLSVNWVRKNPNTCSGTSIQHEQHSLLILPCDQLAKLIKNHELCSYVKGVQAVAPNNNFTLILFAVENIFKPNRRKRDAEEYKISREELTEALVEVQLFTNSCHRFVENCIDFAMTISQFSKAIAEIPFRLEKQKKEQDKLEWFGESDSRDCVRVDKNGNGLMRLWRQQLCEFNLAGLQIAEAITAIYPSPQSLFQAYDRCSSQSEREKMLQDIQIRRGVGVLSSARRIGPELSKKLHTFFTTLDGDIELSNE